MVTRNSGSLLAGCARRLLLVFFVSPPRREVSSLLCPGYRALLSCLSCAFIYPLISPPPVRKGSVQNTVYTRYSRLIFSVPKVPRSSATTYLWWGRVESRWQRVCPSLFHYSHYFHSRPSPLAALGFSSFVSRLIWRVEDSSKVRQVNIHAYFVQHGRPPGKMVSGIALRPKKSLTRKPDSPSAGVCQMAVEQCNSTAHSIGRPWRPQSQITNSRNPWARRLGAISIRERRKFHPCLSPFFSFFFLHMAIPLSILNGPHGPTRSLVEGIKKEKKKRH